MPIDLGGGGGSGAFSFKDTPTQYGAIDAAGQAALYMNWKYDYGISEDLTTFSAIFNDEAALKKIVDDARFINDEVMLDPYLYKTFPFQHLRANNPRAWTGVYLPGNVACNDVRFVNKGYTAMVLDTSGNLTAYSLPERYHITGNTQTSTVDLATLLSAGTLVAFDINRAGTLLYCVDTAKVIYEVELSTAWDVSTATASGSYDASTDYGSFAANVTMVCRITNDGKLHVSGNASTDDFQLLGYSFGTPGDISTINLDSTYLDQDIYGGDVTEDGQTLYCWEYTSSTTTNPRTMAYQYLGGYGPGQDRTASRTLIFQLPANTSPSTNFTSNYGTVTRLRLSEGISYTAKIGRATDAFIWECSLKRTQYDGTSSLNFNKGYIEEMTFFTDGGVLSGPGSFAIATYGRIEATVPSLRKYGTSTYELLEANVDNASGTINPGGYGGIEPGSMASGSAGPIVSEWSSNLNTITQMPNSNPNFTTFDASWSPDGNYIYVSDYSTEIIYTYKTKYPYDYFLAEIVGAKSLMELASQIPLGATFVSIAKFNYDGTKCYIVRTSGSTVYQFTLTTPFDVSTGTYDGNFIGANTTIQHVDFTPDSRLMVVMNNAGVLCCKYTETPGDFVNGAGGYQVLTTWDGRNVPAQFTASPYYKGIKIDSTGQYIAVYGDLNGTNNRVEFIRMPKPYVDIS